MQHDALRDGGHIQRHDHRVVACDEVQARTGELGASDHPLAVDFFVLVDVVAVAVDPDEVLRLVVAPNHALLIGSDDATRLGATTSAVPWGHNRVLATFHVERDT